MYTLNTMRIDRFEQLLREHKFAVSVKDPMELRHVLKKESGLLRHALNGDHRFLDLYYRFQQKAVQAAAGGNSVGYKSESPKFNDSQIRVVDDKPKFNDNGYGRKIQATEFTSGTSALDLVRFRTAVRNFDWEYYLVRQSDPTRYEEGRQVARQLRNTAKNCGGVFLSFWIDECQKRGFMPFPERRNA